MPQQASGTKLAPLKERLARIGLKRDWDYVLHLPLRYEDETRITPIGSLRVGQEAQVLGTVMRSEVSARGQLTALVRDDSGFLKIRFIHFYPSQEKLLSEGAEVLVFGKYQAGWNGPEMVHPKVRRSEAAATLPSALTPIYPAGESITQTWLRKRIARALLDVDTRDLLPPEILARLGLPDLKSALEHLHHPKPGSSQAALSDRTDPAWLRVKFDEFVAQQLALAASRHRRSGFAAPALTKTGHVTEGLLAALPFALTGAQQRVSREIAQDLSSGRPMNRLVQGDVGSGKTVVAALAAARAIDSGFQAALMAPTEILAEQHFRKIAAWLEPLGVRVAWLAGSLKAREKAQAQADVASGEADLVIGTHALIQDAVHFPRLGLAIVDEQHRFGVGQRLALRSPQDGKDRMPHLLMLTATPIPRTLAMSYLSDISVSTIDELPPGRTPIDTRMMTIARKKELIEAVGRLVRAGGQAYWVCPLIEASEELDLTAATESFEQIRAQLPGVGCALVHGRLSPADKQAAMDSFAAGKTSILVATTVIEVGVDVPNANLMVIEHAERFGLAQLHQLRGRVGRGARSSYCFLLYGDVSETGLERLRILRDTNDGFEIARRDLELRGPGEFLGVRQSGVPLLRFGDLRSDAALLEKARQFADRWIEDDPQKAAEQVRRWFEHCEDMLEA